MDILGRFYMQRCNGRMQREKSAEAQQKYAAATWKTLYRGWRMMVIYGTSPRLSYSESENYLTILIILVILYV